MLTVADLRLHITTDLTDEALQLLLDAAYQTIDRYLGAGSGDDIRELLSPGSGELLMLSRAAAAVTTVVEDDVSLASDDWELVGNQMLHRLDDGTNPRITWYGKVDVTYTGMADAAERDRVAIALCRLDVTHNPGLVSQKLGDWSETYAQGGDRTYSQERADILASLSQPDLFII